VERSGERSAAASAPAGRKLKPGGPLAASMQKATLPPVLRESHVPGLTLVKRGKVRDVYEHEGKIVLVATDRLSAFDVVLPNPIPAKGVTLTQLSNHWFDFAKSIAKNHLVETDFARFPAALQRHAELRGRTVVARKAQPLAIECIVRGYLSGSGWKDYQRTGAVCGIRLPAGLQESAKLPEPIFTPSTKAEKGHDENITEAQAERVVGKDVYRQAKAASLRIYQAASDAAAAKGVIIADTKFEFGTTPDGLLLIDEVLTPDSSRFWPADGYRVGTSPPSFDKQYVRDYLERIKWNKQPPAPELPAEVVAGTTQRYLEAYRRITGRELRF
jgi:phosphoribosylaminoimidazole-succinocarboxamide synthase